MSTSEMVAEKVKGMPEFQAQAVLAFIEELSASPVIGAADLMRLPLAERRRILTSQARQAEALYRQDSNLIAQDNGEPLGYE